MAHTKKKKPVSQQKLLNSVDALLSDRQKNRFYTLEHCQDGEETGCSCSTPLGAAKAKVDLVILIDTSGSMSSSGKAISAVAEKAVREAQKNCPTDLKIDWFGIEGTFSGSKFDNTHRKFLTDHFTSQSKPVPTFYSSTVNAGDFAGQKEEGADATADIAKYYPWRKGACRAIFYISDEPLDQGTPQNASDSAATLQAIGIANANNVTVFTHYVRGKSGSLTAKDFTDLAVNTGGKVTIGGNGTEKQYTSLLQDIICNACGGCKEIIYPEVSPCISVSWGDSDCDCLETDDFELFSVSVCNCYSNVTFENFAISQIEVTDVSGKKVPMLPDGTPSVEVIPIGPYCFGDIGPCVDNNANCVTREFAIRTRGAKAGKYKLHMRGISYNISNSVLDETCFEIKLCLS